jgi:4-amino-4-deoxy-L-arabinose transferase-like glycosyltransferase
MNRFLSFFRKNRSEVYFVAAILLLSSVAMGWNLFHYPSYFDDEGTYMARAVAIAYHHSLSPYTYWYDHAPGGTIIIAIWLRLTGGTNTFGSSVINSGRALMLLVHVLSVFFIYLIAKHYRLKRIFIAFIILFFSLSPLVIVLQRMVLLDNLMTLLLLISFYLLLRYKSIYKVLLSGALLGSAVLVKETAVFFIPGSLLLLFRDRPRHYRKFSSIVWISSLLGVIAIYPIFALLRGEFFPAGSYFGGKSPHVSLITSLIWQESRKGGAFYSRSGQLYFSIMHSWLFTDPVFMVVGTISSLAMLITSFWKRKYLSIEIMTFGYVYYLLRGGIVNDQYLIPLLPFFALNIGFALSELYSSVKKINIIKLSVISLMIAIFTLTIFWDIKTPDLYILDATKPQIEAVDWAKQNIPSHSLTDIDSYAMSDLIYAYGSNTYKKYGYQDFWEIDQDPELTSKTLKDNWKSINYIIMTPRMLTDVDGGGLPLSSKAIKEYSISYPETGISGYLYRNSYHRQILIATTPYVEIKKVY